MCGVGDNRLWKTLLSCSFSIFHSNSGSEFHHSVASVEVVLILSSDNIFPVWKHLLAHLLKWCMLTYIWSAWGTWPCECFYRCVGLRLFYDLVSPCCRCLLTVQDIRSHESHFKAEGIWRYQYLFCLNNNMDETKCFQNFMIFQLPPWPALKSVYHLTSGLWQEMVKVKYHYKFLLEYK